MSIVSIRILWIATSNGLNRFDPKTEQFSRFYFPEEGGSAWVIRIVAEGDSILWLATMNGLVRFRKRTGEHQKVFWPNEHGDIIEGRRVNRALSRLDDGCLAVGSSRNDFYKFNPGTFEFTELHDSLAARNWGGGFCCYRDSDGLVWFGLSGRGIFCLDQKTDNFKSYISKDGKYEFSIMRRGKPTEMRARWCC